MQAYRFLATALQEAHPEDLLVQGDKLVPAAGCEDCSVGLLSRQDLAASSSVLPVLESPRLAWLVTNLLQVSTFCALLSMPL